MNIIKSFKALSKFELMLWLFSMTVLIITFIFGDKSYALTFIDSLIGITSLIFLAKGNVLGQVLMVIFSVLYGIISFTFQYYGEMITYAGMTAPMAFISIIAWLKHPSEKGLSEVKIGKLSKLQIVFLIIFTILVTTAFYFILKFLNTANLEISTISVATSFAAVYLSLFRSPFYAILYALNDIVLIILWVLASIENTSYLSMVICFCIFFLNDLYGFYNWQRIKHRQQGQ